MAVDDDVRALERIRAELDRRYTHDYRIVCHRSAEAAATDLASLREAGEEVAVVLADQWTAGLPGTALLARARELHPLARRALLIEWGGWADRPTAEAIFEGMARGDMDYYVIKPALSPNELFHRTWASSCTNGRGSAPGPSARSPSSARNGRPARTSSGRCSRATGFPTSSRAASRRRKRLLESAGRRADTLPIAIVRDGQVLTDPTKAQLAARSASARSSATSATSTSRSSAPSRAG